MKNYEFQLIFRPDAILLGATYNPKEANKDWYEINIYILCMVLHFKIFT